MNGDHSTAADQPRQSNAGLEHDQAQWNYTDRYQENAPIFYSNEAFLVSSIGAMNRATAEEKVNVPNTFSKRVLFFLILSYCISQVLFKLALIHLQRVSNLQADLVDLLFCKYPAYLNILPKNSVTCLTNKVSNKDTNK